jgi:predicted ATPase
MTLPKHVFSGGVQRIVQRRLDHVPQDARALLDLAAVLGRQVNQAVLHVARERHQADYPMPLERWLTTCSNAAVLDVQDDQWRFAHDKLRDGVLIPLSEEDTQTLHRRAAEVLESLYGDDPSHAASLAQHWMNAQVIDKALQNLDVAGRH